MNSITAASLSVRIAQTRKFALYDWEGVKSAAKNFCQKKKLNITNKEGGRHTAGVWPGRLG